MIFSSGYGCGCFHPIRPGEVLAVKQAKRDMWDDFPEEDEEEEEDMADDLISRKAVLDFTTEWCNRCGKRKEYDGVLCKCCDLDDTIDFIEELPTIPQTAKEDTAECFTLEELESWLWKNVLNNSDNAYGESVETLIGRLDGFKRFVEDSRMKGEGQ